MLKIYGCSDDLVEFDGIIREEVNTAALVITIGWPDGQPSEDRDPSGVRVRMEYAPHWESDGNGVWVASIAPLDEGVPFPWVVRVTAEKYSAVVEIDCPEGTPVTWKED